MGALGQIGTELVEALVESNGSDNVVAADIREPEKEMPCKFEILNAVDKARLEKSILENEIGTVYQLVATLSAKAESNPLGSWKLNMESLFIFLEFAREQKIQKLFWPSSIAVFGPTTPRDSTPQKTITEPNTVYGISKLAGERWCEYYANKYGLDIRSIRYPGLIGYKSLPGGGTTDYAVDIFHKALSGEVFECFLNEETRLPMMYMPDAIRGTLQLMEANSSDIKIRSSYNFSGISFTPEEIYAEIKRHLPEFQISYKSDSRQAIADSWPRSIDDQVASKDWGWKPQFSLEDMVKDILSNLPKHFSF